MDKNKYLPIRHLTPEQQRVFESMEFGQRQDSLFNQMQDLRALAVKFGMYDADDWISRHFFGDR